MDESKNLLSALEKMLAMKTAVVEPTVTLDPTPSTSGLSTSKKRPTHQIKPPHSRNPVLTGQSENLSETRFPPSTYLLGRVETLPCSWNMQRETYVR